MEYDIREFEILHELEGEIQHERLEKVQKK